MSDILFFWDDITNTAGVSLHDTTSTSGHAWDQYLGTGAGANGFVYTNANRLYQNAAFAAGVSYPVVTPPSADYWVEAVFVVFTHAAEQYPGILIRLDTAIAGVDCYRLLYDTLGGGWEIDEISNNVSTSIGTVAQTLVDGASYCVRFLAVGTSLTALIDRAILLTVTNAVHAGAGVPAINNYNPAASSNTTQIHQDQIKAGTTEPVLTAPPANRKRQAGHSVSSPGTYF